MADSNTTWSLITAYLTRGWSVVPLHHVDALGTCSCHDGGSCLNPGKHPLYKNWQRLRLDIDALVHVLRHRPEMNVGIATGRASGVWALDEDPHNGGNVTYLEHLLGAPLPVTWSQRTGSGGRHWLFSLPADFDPTNSPGRLPAGFDVRGTGGQIVVAPSRTNKGDYLLLSNANPVPAPAALLDLVRPAAYTARDKTSSSKINMTELSAEAQRARAYGLTAAGAECRALAAESSSRNVRAYAAACRLHELINAEWISYDEGEEQYLAACAAASSNKIESFTEREALTVWANAAHKVGDQAATLPPSALGGERLDFPSGTMAPPSSPTSAAGSSASLDELMASGVSLANTIERAPAQLTLPAAFWEERPVLKHIRDAAHARLVSADVALYTVLARLASLWPHRVRLDSGVRSPAAANLFVAVVGPSGAGKTSGVSVAEDLLDRPPWLERADYGDGLPLGSGEGIAEAYMGTAKRAKLDTDGQPVIMRTGEAKTESYRTQTRHNVFMYADEGESLAKLVERTGATVGEALRRAWVGATIGQANGRAETTRIIEKGRYSLGLVIGFQPETAQHLLADVHAGTPQRFLWAWTADKGIPDHPVSSPGPLRDVWPAPAPPPPEGFTPWLVDPGGQAEDLREVTYPASVRDELWHANRLMARDEVTVQEYDAHRSLMLVKLSALLAQLEGRRDVSEEDWRLAQVIWGASCRVRDHLLEYGQLITGKARAAQRHAKAEEATDAEVARLAVLADRDKHDLERLAVVLARKLQAHPRAPATLGALRRGATSRDRSIVAEALSLASARGWISEADGSYSAGSISIG